MCGGGSARVLQGADPCRAEWAQEGGGVGIGGVLQRPEIK